MLQRVVAILPYTKMPDTDELTFQKGDIFFCHNDMGDGWLWVTAHRFVFICLYININIRKYLLLLCFKELVNKE